MPTNGWRAAPAQWPVTMPGPSIKKVFASRVNQWLFERLPPNFGIGLAQLDAGSWHSADFVGTPLPTLAQIADFCLKHGALINLEIKATPGLETRTGDVVAKHAAKLWKDATVPPLLSSFDVPSLEAALRAQPELPRALLLEELWPGWLESALRLRCVGVVCDQVLWDAVSVSQVKTAGLRCLSYTVNDASEAQRLLALGIDCLITDRVDAFKPDA